MLKDLGKASSVEGQIILGAAVIDDVLGLVILAVVTGIIQSANAGQSLAASDVLLVIGKAIGFLGVALGLGIWLSPRLFSVASRLAAERVLLALALAFCFVMAFLANVVGLAPIVGAFAAGLVLESTHFRGFYEHGEIELEEAIRPISGFLVPIFFVLMGIKVDLRTFADPSVLGVAAALCVAAVLGKQICALGVVGLPGTDRLSIGIGMIPRGEVGLIFANIGLGLSIRGTPIISKALFSAVVIMVIVTTLVTPPALKWSLSRPRTGP